MWPIYLSTQMNDLAEMIDPACGLLSVNYIYPDWPTRMDDSKKIGLQRFVKTLARNSPSKDHYLYDGSVASRPNPEGWQITADMPGDKAYPRRFRPNAPFFLDIEYTGRLQKEGDRDDAIDIIDALRTHLGDHYGSSGARIGYHTLGMDFIHTFKRFPPQMSDVESLRRRIRYLNRAQDVQGQFEARAFQDVVDYWCPFVFRLGPSDEKIRHIIAASIRACRVAAPKSILPGWFPYDYGTGRPHTQAEIKHDLAALKNGGADGVLVLGNFHKDENGKAAGKVFTAKSDQYKALLEIAQEINT